MINNKFLKKYQDTVIAIIAVVLLYTVLISRYDFLYELNDDITMRNILSGVYTGSPDPKCIFILYPLSVVISFLYRIMPSLQWYDLFILVCQGLCLFAILKRLLQQSERIAVKLIITLLWFSIISIYISKHIIFMTFTVTSGLLAATAIFLFITEKDKDNIFIKSMPYIFMLLLSFCLRYMMVMMMLPFVCLAGIYKWSKEDKIFSVDNIKKYLSVFAVLLSFVALLFGVDKLAYSSSEWKEFKSFCNDRANVYDYSYVPKYEGNEEFYQNNNISYEQCLLLRSYDYILDDEINSDMMKRIADYTMQTGPTVKEKINNALGGYREQITDNVGKPYHTLILVGYLVLLLSINRKNKFKILASAAILFFVRSLIWLYLWGQGRIVERVTYPLYWCEFLFLIALFVEENKDNIKYIISIILITVLAAFVFNSSMYDLETKYIKLNEKAEVYEVAQKYCLENSDNFYFTPVYSLGIKPEKVFSSNAEPENLEMLGGWIAKSPLYYKKMANFGIDSVENSLIYNKNVYIIQEKDYISYETSYPFEWLVLYYEQKGENVEVVKTDLIIDNIEVYKVNFKN